MAVFWPTVGFNGRTFVSSGLFTYTSTVPHCHILCCVPLSNTQVVWGQQHRITMATFHEASSNNTCPFTHLPPSSIRSPSTLNVSPFHTLFLWEWLSMQWECENDCQCKTAIMWQKTITTDPLKHVVTIFCYITAGWVWERLSVQWYLDTLFSHRLLCFQVQHCVQIQTVTAVCVNAAPFIHTDSCTALWAVTWPGVLTAVHQHWTACVPRPTQCPSQ